MRQQTSGVVYFHWNFGRWRNRWPKNAWAVFCKREYRDLVVGANLGPVFFRFSLRKA